MKNIKPSLLKPGDKIGIISPARFVAPAEIEGAIKWISEMGFEPVLGKHVFARKDQFAGTDLDRASDIIDFIEDPDISCIWASRGGYGSIRLIPFLEKIDPSKNPKWFIGYSDITVFHSWLLEKFKLQSIHGPMLFSWNESNESQEAFKELFNLLSKGKISYSYPQHHLNTGESMSGVITGGNLSVLFSMRGSGIDLNVQKRILFIEDIDEYQYHIDRMMQNLRQAGWLNKISGLLVGGMTDMNDNQIPFGRSAEEIISDITSDLSIPVIFGHPAGHIKRNIPLIFGEKINIRIEGRMIYCQQ